MESHLGNISENLSGLPAPAFQNPSSFQNISQPLLKFFHPISLLSPAMHWFPLKIVAQLKRKTFLSQSNSAPSAFHWTINPWCQTNGLSTFKMWTIWSISIIKSIISHLFSMTISVSSKNPTSLKITNISLKNPTKWKYWWFHIWISLVYQWYHHLSAYQYQ